MGEVCLCIAALFSLEASLTNGKALQPLNYSVGVAGGAQIIGHAVKAGHLAHPDQVTVQLDFRNAFNALCREAMLKAILLRALG